MAKMSLSDRDLEALSAYLDGELSGKELERLEANIQTNEELRNTLERLQQTRTMMRSLPTLRAPRNYYLTPAVVGEKYKPRRAFPVLRLASVLATLLLVLLFLGDVFVLPNQVLAPAKTIRFAESAVEEVEQLEMEAEIIEGQLPEASAEQSMDRLDMEGEAAPPAAEAMISPAVEATPGVDKSLATSLPAPAGEMEGDAAPPAAELMISPAVEATPREEKLLATALPAPAEEMDDVIGGVAELEEELDLKIETRELFTQPEVEPQPLINLRFIVRVVEIALIIIALSTGLAAFFLYLKNH